ncbi:MAG: fructose-6-phosphate aldolase [Flavobacteriales bacterium]|nr:fructose-6-phosphate aldolase [Flavobacteriales bacterium]MBT5749847.1 fructose-6-phosphate aldolase [Flavobacteriales bacterium]
MLYILKIKGTKTIPDFVQIRDEQMTLCAYFRLSQQKVGLKKNNLEAEAKGIMTLLKNIPYGKIHKYYNRNE